MHTLTGYVVPERIGDGTWMALENYSVAATVVAASPGVGRVQPGAWAVGTRVGNHELETRRRVGNPELETRWRRVGNKGTRVGNQVARIHGINENPWNP